MEVDLGSRFVEYQLKRSARARYARLEIHLHRGVRVVLPAAAPADDAEKLIRLKSEWLLRQLTRFDRLRTIVPDRKFVTGETLPDLGETLTLEVSKGAVRVERRGTAIGVSHPKPTARNVRLALEDWYVDRADDEIARRAEDLAARLGIRIRGVRVSRAHTRWGSCSTTGRINLNWRLLLGPPEILDYLIAHELAHVDHPNHSRGFWDRVAELHSEHRSAERWLRKYGAGLVL
jgi:predicted metal-dependent hydrolase